MIILGIETSCDDTCIGILKITNNQKHILVNLKENQDTLHAKYGGIVPEVAARGHLYIIDILFQHALKFANISAEDIDLIGVTTTPGLIGSLLIGINFAKGLSIALNIPIIYVNHIESHILSSFISDIPIILPMYSLLISGGHTSLIYYENLNNYKIIENTHDDAIGELFDKVGREMNLPFPAGKHIEQIALNHHNTLPLIIPSILSFSGLKTHFIRMIRENKYHPEDIAQNLQMSVCALLHKILKKHCKFESFIVAGGGVTANKYIREFLTTHWSNIHFPHIDLSTDNGVMIAYTAYCQHIKKIL